MKPPIPPVAGSTPPTPERTAHKREPPSTHFFSKPLEDATCDRVVVHDAFHHVPNQEQVLSELFRITRDGGIVAMCEPGRAHSLTEDSRREMETTGVLENDIVVEDLGRLARSLGFHNATVVPLSLGGVAEVGAEKFPAFLMGRGLARYWSHHARALLGSHFIFLYKGEYRPTSIRADGLRAHIDLLKGDRFQVAAGAKVEVPMLVRNEGQARWLGERHGVPGTTNVGAHLRDANDRMVDYDWYRLPLGADLEPGQERRLTLTLVAPAHPGRHVVEVDMVAEGVAWFAQLGSPTAKLILDVKSSI